MRAAVSALLARQPSAEDPPPEDPPPEDPRDSPPGEQSQASDT